MNALKDVARSRGATADASGAKKGDATAIAVERGNWILSAPETRRDECRNAKASMSEEAETAAMAPYLESLKIIETAMTTQAPSTRPKVGSR